MPPKGYSWRQERDWDVHNAHGWLTQGLPLHLSSETLNGCKATKKKLARTMELKCRNFIPAMPTGLPSQVVARLLPLMNAVSFSRHLVGVQDEPFDFDGMDEDDTDFPIREVMLSSFTLTALEGAPGARAEDTLNVVFLRNAICHQCTTGAVVLTCQFDADKPKEEKDSHGGSSKEGKQPKSRKGRGSKEEATIKTLMRVGIGEEKEYGNVLVDEVKIGQVMTRLGLNLTSTDTKITPSQMIAFLLSLCYPVAEGEDFNHEYVKKEILAEIKSFCPNESSRAGFVNALAFLGGQHTRLGQASKVNLLPEIPLQMIVTKFLALPDQVKCFDHYDHYPKSSSVRCR